MLPISAPRPQAPRRRGYRRLFYVDHTNLRLYVPPQWQGYLPVHTSGTSVLAFWGPNNVISIKAGAEAAAFVRDVKEFVLDFVDSKHVAPKTHVDHYAEHIGRQVLVCENPQRVVTLRAVE